MSSLLARDVLEEWVRTEITSDQTLNGQAIDAGQSLLAEMSGREFVLVTVDTTASARTFTPEHCRMRLNISDAASITSVVENGVTLTDGTHYLAEPNGNRHRSTGEWRPYSTLVRLDNYWYTNGPRRTVTVTAKWGWTTLPVVATEALKVLAADWLAMRNSRNGVVSVTTEGFSIGMRDNPLVKAAAAAVAGPMSADWMVR
jgi:hypothetical protein